MSGLDGRVRGALASLTQETTLALASINFDFSLYKVDAPKEYQSLGNALSKKRREAAEQGSEHTFARRLGALFSQSLPNTPNLTRAYGSRCSQIAESPAFSPRGTRQDGIFEEWVGADATSIWAAATSGQGALAVHLLACMLARMWSASEAIAIWDELIQVRKQELSKLDPSEPLNLHTLSAVGGDITREQMARWDASARAWLSVADGCMKREQTQLTLLIKDLGLPVSKGDSVYSSVLDTWIIAMQTMESIVTGMPQSIREASALVGLLSWHLYPDIYALYANSKKVAFHDALIPASAVVTLGAVSSSPAIEDSIHWSLPLAYLRFYGEPVRTFGSVDKGSTRLTIHDCFFVLLGAVFSGWGKYGDDFQKACALIMAIEGAVSRNRESRANQPRTWLTYLSNTAETFLSSSGSHKDHCHSLIARGRRRHGSFLPKLDNRSQPTFGLSNVNQVLELISDPEKRLEFLRLVSSTFSCGPDDLLIRYCPPATVEMDGLDWSSFISDGCYLASNGTPAGSVLPSSISPSSSQHRGAPVQFGVPNSTLTSPFQKYGTPNLSGLSNANSTGIGQWNSYRDYNANGNYDTRETKWIYATALKSGHNPSKRKADPAEDMTGHCRWQWNPSFTLKERLNGEIIKPLELVDATDSDSSSFRWSVEAKVQSIRQRISAPIWTKYRCIFGNPAVAAVFKKEASNVFSLNEVPVDVLRDALDRDLLDGALLVHHLNALGDYAVSGDPFAYTNCLSSFSAAADAYRLMPSATIHPGIFSQPLHGGHWLPSRFMKGNDAVQKGSVPEDVRTRPKLLTYGLTREQTISCIARFENVNVNLEPQDLAQVMAVSTGNSIYVSMPLACDPYEQPLEYEWKHIIGNIGKPGLNLMIPPSAPCVRKLDEGNWTNVNHADFDGNLDDSFQHTSLHLSFTRYRVPAGTASHGNQAVEAYFIETLVSVYDRASWVADLDILAALSKACFKRLARPDTCRHKGIKCPRFLLTSIDSWEEYLDPPPDPAIFRSNGNWLARLAIVAMSALRDRETLLFQNGDAICWQCIAQIYQDSSEISLSVHNKHGQTPLFVC